MQARAEKRFEGCGWEPCAHPSSLSAGLVEPPVTEPQTLPSKGASDKNGWVQDKSQDSLDSEAGDVPTSKVVLPTSANPQAFNPEICATVTVPLLPRGKEMTEIVSPGAF